MPEAPPAMLDRNVVMDVGAGWLMPSERGDEPRYGRLEIRDGRLRLAGETRPEPAIRGLLAFPGLVNSHEHVEFDCYPQLGRPPYPDDAAWAADLHRIHAATIASIEALPFADRAAWGLARNALCGVSTVVNHGPDRRADFVDAPVGVVTADDFNFIHSVAAARSWRRRLLGPLRRGPVVVHLGEGVSERSRREAKQLLRWNMLRRRVVAVHGVALDTAQARQLEALVWCPSSNLFLLGRTADVARLERSTRVLFGTDSSLTAAGHFFHQLRTAREIGALSDRALFASIGAAAREIWRLPHDADAGLSEFTLARAAAPEPWDAFFGLEPRDLLLIVRDGRIVSVDRQFAARQPALEKTARALPTLRIGDTDKHTYADLDVLSGRLARAAPEAAPALDVLQPGEPRAPTPPPPRL